ncbi:olfactory receptor class A-like protein 1 [Protopterus annectens]|uniref:olfactory receptor class A-like protein 1 n=1 Tax=Protopterus annectens TaxID=7888 RepID=UPI001CF99089|nr:olfactory receptor class A-like protein 1 [Protopterus annectens]
MEVNEVIKGIFFLVIAVIGIPGNLVIMGSFSWTAYTTLKLLPVEVVICNLAVANLILAFTRGLPAALFMLFHLKINSDIGCIILVYLARISRGLAMCFTCVLSCVQFITIIPTTSKWVYLKPKVTKHIFFIAFILWPLYLLMETAPIFVARAVMNFTSSEFTFNFGYCLALFPTALTYHLNGFGLFSRDLILVGVMSLASTSILHILLKHRKQLNDIRKSNGSEKSVAEISAAKIIVTLVIIYVIFFGVENTIWFYQIIGSTVVHHMTSDVRHFFSVCYTFFFPAAIIVTNKKVKNVLNCSSRQENIER